MLNLAVVQEAPTLLDVQACIDTARSSIQEASSKGADLVVFPEAFLPGYPTWVWRLKPGADMSLIAELHNKLLESSIDIEAGGLAPICDAARESSVTVVMGIQEREGHYSRGTLYNTCVVIGPDGTLLNRHRKLMPTNPERMVWGQGDASGLRVVDTPAGRIGTLLCWESYMPLARYALYSQGVEVYVTPTWDTGERWMATLRHIAAEGGCWVVSCASPLRRDDVPEDFPERSRVFPESEDWINPGDAVVFAPFGGPVAGPMHQEKGLLHCEYDLAAVAKAHRSLDVAGHYQRPDIFELRVDRSPRSPITFRD